DDKIIAVTISDPAFAEYTHHDQLPEYLVREIKRFFQDYKVLEHKQVEVDDFMGPIEACRILREALDMYRQLRRGELGNRPTKH
ncbi:MAG TPA: inorganic diphosphatase, partial [Pirellulales bacterium]|nr:inorganic diphosphatase [Pirellulales bacterium]